VTGKGTASKGAGSREQGAGEKICPSTQYPVPSPLILLWVMSHKTLG
jgi:hypothetical protein